jgi:hypothetical protein
MMKTVAATSITLDDEDGGSGDGNDLKSEEQQPMKATNERGVTGQTVVG